MFFFSIIATTIVKTFQTVYFMDAITVNISKQTMGFSSASWMILVSLKFIFFFHFVLSVILNAFLSVCWSWLSVLLWQQEALCSLDLSQVDFTLGWEGGQVAFSWVTPKCHYLCVFSLGSVSVSILLGNYKLGCQYSIRWKNPWFSLGWANSGHTATIPPQRLTSLSRYTWWQLASAGIWVQST